MKLEGHPHKAAILEALEQRRLGRVDAFFESFLTELAVTGGEPRFLPAMQNKFLLELL